MSEWREVMLGDVIELYDHKRVPLSGAERRTRQGPFPYYGAQGVIDHIDDYLFDGRYILIPEDGENLNSRKLPIAYFADGKFWVNNHAHVARARHGIAVDRFVQSALEASDIRGFITGAAQPKLSQENLLRIRLLLPPIEDQMRIAWLLDALDELIEKNRRRIVLLERMAQAIYHEWFVERQHPAQDAVTLADVAILVRRNMQPRRSGGEDFEHFSIPSFDESGLPRTEKGDSIKSGKYLVCDPAVLVSKLNPRIPRVWLVEPSSKDRSVASTEFLVLEPRPPWSLELLYLLTSSAPFRDALVGLSGGTSNSHQRAKPADFMQLPVITPPAALLSRITDAVAPPLGMARALRLQGARVGSLRDLLLPKLVTGAIDVSRLDLDELLEQTLA